MKKCKSSERMSKFEREILGCLTRRQTKETRRMAGGGPKRNTHHGRIHIRGAREKYNGLVE